MPHWLRHSRHQAQIGPARRAGHLTRPASEGDYTSCHEIQESAIPDWFLVYPRIKPCSYPKASKATHAQRSREAALSFVIICSPVVCVLYSVDPSYYPRISEVAAMLQRRRLRRRDAQICRIRINVHWSHDVDSRLVRDRKCPTKAAACLRRGTERPRGSAAAERGMLARHWCPLSL